MMTMIETHTIGYAAPGSDWSDQAGGAGWIVSWVDPAAVGADITDGIRIRLWPTYEAAQAFAAGLGSRPDRLSLDHPANGSLLAEAL